MPPIHTFAALATSVRARRLDLGLSQQALAERAGVSRPWIARFESGKSSSEIGLLLRVLDALTLELSVHVSDERPAGAYDPDLDLDDLIEGLSSR